MMHKNLFETWERLAKHEADHIWEFDTETRKQIGKDAGIESWLAQSKNRAILKGYIERCAQDRGWTTHVQISKRFCACEVVVNSLYFHEDCRDSNILQIFSTAYLTALAAQRSPNPGAWQHFKGDTMEVVGLFSFGTRDCEDGDFSEEGLFTFEEDPTLSFQLLCWGDGHMEFQHTALSLGFLPDRVAYIHEGKGYLRKVENFLGLVGPEHPEHQGKLRFTEVSNAKM